MTRGRGSQLGLGMEVRIRGRIDRKTGRRSLSSKFLDRIRSLLIPLIETKDVLDIECLSERSLWDVCR